MTGSSALNEGLDGIFKISESDDADRDGIIRDLEITTVPSDETEDSFIGNGLVKARDLVQAILDQLTLNDSPPVNDDIAKLQEAQIIAHTHQKQGRRTKQNLARNNGRQNNMNPGSMNSVVSTVSMTTSSAASSYSHQLLESGLNRQRHVFPLSSIRPSNGHAQYIQHTSAVSSPISTTYTDRSSYTASNIKSETDGQSLDDAMYSLTATSSFGSNFSSTAPDSVRISSGIPRSNLDPLMQGISNQDISTKYSGSVQTMGNTSLVALCTHTLETVGSNVEAFTGEDSFSDEKEDTDIKEIKNKDVKILSPVDFSRIDSNITLPSGNNRENRKKRSMAAKGEWMNALEEVINEEENKKSIDTESPAGMTKKALELCNINCFTKKNDQVGVESDVEEFVLNDMDSPQMSKDSSLDVSLNTLQSDLVEKISRAPVEKTSIHIAESTSEEQDTITVNADDDSTIDCGSEGLSFKPALKASIEAEDVKPHKKLPPDTAFQSTSVPKFTQNSFSPKIIKSIQQPRIQMFGSEYARHLSSLSPFSPAPVKMNRRRGNKIHKGVNKKQIIASKRQGVPPVKPSSNTTVAFSAMNALSPLSTSSGGFNTSETLDAKQIKQESSKGSDFDIDISPSGSNLSNTSFIPIPTTTHQPKAKNTKGLPTILSSRKLRVKEEKNGRVINLEDAPDNILSGAITDIIVTYGKELPPRGYYRITQTSDGKDVKNLKTANLPKRKAVGVYLNVKKEPNWNRAVQRPCVTAIVVIFPDRNEFVPPGFSVVRRHYIKHDQTNYPSNSSMAGSEASRGKGGSLASRNESLGDRDSDVKSYSTQAKNQHSSNQLADLNYGTTGERVFICYRRSREGNPITGLIPLEPSSNELVPEGYTVLEKTPRNFSADINSKAGPAIFLAFRQRLANLETLRPLPLILSVHYNKVQSDYDDGESKVSSLQAYYCTGGTVVSSDVGRLHVMDRSTHALVSPSSVTNRLHMIEESRFKRSISNISTREVVESKKSSLTNIDLVDNGEQIPKPCQESDLRDRSDEAHHKPLAGRPPIHNDEESIGSCVSTDFNSIHHQNIPPMQSLNYPMNSENRSVSENSTIMLCPESMSINDSKQHLEFKIYDKKGPVKKLFGSETNFYDDAKTINKPSLVHFEEDKISTIENSFKGSIFASQNDATLQSCFDVMNFIPPIESPYNSQFNYNLDDFDPVQHQIQANILLQARIAVITPILTACYTCHGGSGLIAVEGLTKLLNETDFFVPDIAADKDPHTSVRTTILDLSVQIVCDVATSSVRETNFLSCVEFVSDAVKYVNGKLNSRTLGYITRFYLFIFHFGASVPKHGWPNMKNNFSEKSNTRESPGIDRFNYEPILGTNDVTTSKSRRIRVYYPGGAPQAAAAAFKEFLTLFLNRFQKINPSYQDMIIGASSSMGSDGNAGDQSSNDLDSSIVKFSKDIVNSLIDGAVHRVDISNFTELALHQIHRSGGSELFWNDMTKYCGGGIFLPDQISSPETKDFCMLCFAVLTTIVKVSSGHLRRLVNSTEYVPRDLASKFLSLELLHHFLQRWRIVLDPLTPIKSSLSFTRSKIHRYYNTIGSEDSIARMAYAIRRLVVPCILSNTSAGLEDIQIFKRMMNVVSELWNSKHYRKHIKIELGVLIEHFVLKFLRLGPQVVPPTRLSLKPMAISNNIKSSLFLHQLVVLSEVGIWFSSDPRDILELFLNFDQVDATTSQNHIHLLPSSHWKITQQLCGTICNLTEQCTELVSEQIRLTRIDLAGVESNSTKHSVSNDELSHYTQEDLNEMALSSERARTLRTKCFDTLGQIVKCLMLCAAAASGANYNLLTTLRAERNFTEDAKTEKYRKTVATGEADYDADDGEESDSSVSSAGDMTIKSVSTIGTIIGGLKKTEDVNSEDFSVQCSSNISPMAFSPASRKESSKISGIIEYWNNSIATDRRRSSNPSDSKNQPVSGAKSQLLMRPGAKDLPPKSPLRKDSGPTKVSPMQTKSKLGVVSPTRREVTSNNEAQEKSKAPMRKCDDASVASSGTMSVPSILDAFSKEGSNEVTKSLEVAFEIAENKSLKKAIDYLTACNILTNSPRDIASFLRLNQTKLNPVILGDYLGEGGIGGGDIEHFNLIRFNYVRAISFFGMNVEQGLRHFLTNCGFRLPGEAQKIDRIMTTFGQCFWEDNAGDSSRCPFRDEDTVFLIAFAIIMLNTDLHKVSTFVQPGQSVGRLKQRKTMTKSEFLNNLRGVDASEDLSKEYLSQIYDSIEANPIAIHHLPGNKLHIINGKAQSLRKISGMDIADMINFLVKSVKPSQELLRGLAVHDHPYLTIRSQRSRRRSKRNAVPEVLVRAAFGSTWHHFHGVVNTALDSAHLDPKGLENSLDVLKNSLCAAICLDLTVERNAFAVQLVRVKCFRENRGLEEDENDLGSISASLNSEKKSIRDHLDFKNDPWFRRIEQAAESYNDNAKIFALDEVDDMFQKLHASLQVDTKLKQEMSDVTSRIRNGKILMGDPTRYFVKDGVLVKKCKRTGRSIKYNFFLFSDVLIYCHRTSHGDYKVHEELPLHLMKIMDLNSRQSGNQKQKRSFHIIHPKKSFLAIASNFNEKCVWVKSINDAIGREVRRKAQIEGARQAAAAFER